MDGLNNAHSQYAPKAQSKLPTAQQPHQQQQQQVGCPCDVAAIVARCMMTAQHGFGVALACVGFGVALACVGCGKAVDSRAKSLS